MGLIATAFAALTLASPVTFLHSRELPGGGFAEAGQPASPQLTAWAVLGLRAAGEKPDTSYLVAHEEELRLPTDVALVALALGGPPELLDRLPAVAPTLNATYWTMLALRAGGRTVPPATVRRVLSHQARSGGWSWSERGSPDSNDTAAAIQALRAAGVGGTPIARGLAYIRRLQNADGGFELTAGRGSDAQSTAWAIQAFIAAGRKPGAAAYRYLAGLRRSDGSYRYSAKYVTTPVWVTAQVLAAVSRKPFPL